MKDGPRKIKNSTALDSLFADLDQDLEQQYEEEEFEFYLMGPGFEKSAQIFQKLYLESCEKSSLETQCIAEELINEAIQGALEEMYADLAEKLRLEKLEASKNEISVESLVKPSELLKRERSVRRSQKAKKTENVPKRPEEKSPEAKTPVPEVSPAVSEQNERQIEQRDAVNDRLTEEPSEEPVDENMNSIEQGKFVFVSI